MGAELPQQEGHRLLGVLELGLQRVHAPPAGVCGPPGEAARPGDRAGLEGHVLKMVGLTMTKQVGMIS